MKLPRFLTRKPKVTPNRPITPFGADPRDNLALAAESVARLAAPADPRHRRLPSGRTVPASQTGRTWVDLVHRGPDPTGVRRPYVVDAPALTVEVLTAADPSQRARLRRLSRDRQNERQRISRAHRRTIIANRLATPKPSAAVRRGNLARPHPSGDSAT